MTAQATDCHLVRASMPGPGLRSLLAHVGQDPSLRVRLKHCLVSRGSARSRRIFDNTSHDRSPQLSMSQHARLLTAAAGTAVLGGAAAVRLVRQR